VTTSPGPVRVGFLGAGLIATFHSKMLRHAGDLVVRAGVYDPIPDRADAFARASGHVACRSEDEVLDGCDAVYICSWTSEHPRLLDAALERGLAVFCEKPLDTTLAGAEAMAARAREAGVVNQVGLILRRSPAYLWARHLLDDPAAGRLMTTVFRDDQYIPIQGMYGSTWRGDVARAGSGTLLEHSIHDLDMLRFLGGDVLTVSALQSCFHGIAGIEDVVTGTLRFASGATATLSSVWHDNLARPSQRRVELFCERRWIALEGDDWWGPVRWVDADGGGGVLDGMELEAASSAMVDGTLNPDVDFVRCVAEGRPATPDLTFALAAHRVVDAMYRSAAAEGAVVRL
jgi:predicted dehydrogenase